MAYKKKGGSALAGPLHTDQGVQGGLGGEKVHNPMPKTMSPPDPLGYKKA